jgi:hypothetical protein
MGRVASAGDNAAMESWHALLQDNVLDRRRWSTREELHQAIVFWTEHTYNRRRRQRALGKLAPLSTNSPSPPRRSRCRMITTHPVSTDPAAAPTRAPVGGCSGLSSYCNTRPVRRVAARGSAGAS